MSEYKRLAVSGVKWTALSQTVRFITQLLATIVLARLLQPRDFGLVAMATVVTGFASLFRDFGTAAAIIQCRAITDELLDSVFWLNIAIGLSLAAVLVLLTPAVAAAYAEPRLHAILPLLAATLPVASFGLTQQSLMERQSQFARLGRLEIVSVLGGAVVAIASAIAGAGALSLVYQVLVTACINLILIWRASAWRPRLRWSSQAIREIRSFSANLVGFNVFNYAARNADYMLIGRFLGAGDLGLYSMAYRIMLFPIQNISSVVGRAMFPVFSRMQDDNQRLRTAYLYVCAAIAFLTFPAMLGLAVLRERFVMAVIGRTWAPLAGLILFLSFVGLFQSLGTTVGLLYQAKGRTDIMFRWGLMAGSLTVAAFAVGVAWGVAGVAAAYAAIMLLLAYPSFRVPFGIVGLSVADLVRVILPSAFCACVMAVTLALADRALDTTPKDSISVFFALVLCGSVVYGLASAIANRPLLRRMWSAIGERRA